MKETVTVIFSSNDKFAMLLGVALCSLFENRKGDYPISVYVIDSGISVKNKARLSVLEKRYGFTMQYVYFDKPFTEEIPLGDLLQWYTLPIENYHRISLARFLPAKCCRVINLDADIVITGDISELFNVDLEGKTLGVAADCYPSVEDKREHFKKLCKNLQWLMPEKFIYFNSGIMLVDVERWRKQGAESKLIKFIQKNPDKLLFHDQDALNVLFAEDCKELSARYNFSAPMAEEQNCRDPLIIHFAGGAKPWYLFSALPYHAEYVRYANKTPWKYVKYRKVMDIYFAKKYGIYALAWGVWGAYKKIRTVFKKMLGR